MNSVAKCWEATFNRVVLEWTLGCFKPSEVKEDVALERVKRTRQHNDLTEANVTRAYTAALEKQAKY